MSFDNNLSVFQDLKSGGCANFANNNYGQGQTLTKIWS